jgi:hypothetical protein
MKTKSVLTTSQLVYFTNITIKVINYTWRNSLDVLHAQSKWQINTKTGQFSQETRRYEIRMWSRGPTVAVMEVHALSPRRDVASIPYRVAVSHQYSTSFAALRVLNCLYCTGLPCLCCDVITFFAVTSKHKFGEDYHRLADPRLNSWGHF